MGTTTIFKVDYESINDYRKAYQEIKKSYECKTKIDDGKGGTGWMFFESAEDLRIWKNQK